jgi:hypothetical protein
MEKVRTKPEAYIASLPDEVRDDMATLHARLSAVMKGLPAAVWEGTFWGGSAQQIIGYGDYEYAGSRGKTSRWFMVGLSAQKQYISVYVNAVEGRQYLAEKYAKKLGRVKVGKSSISFKRLSDVKLDVLVDLTARARAQLTTPKN